MADEAVAWGQLLWCNCETKPPIRLTKNSIRIGRTSDCDVSFLGNKYISGHHCMLSRNENSKVWLTDNSTNGTFVNDQKLGRNNKFELSHNDKIQLVKRPNQPSEDVVLMYQDLRQLEDEEYNLQENTEEWSSETDTTAELKDQTDSSHETEAEQTKAVAEPDSKILTTTEEKPKDTIGETLTCSICQDIFHDCLSLQPCMHSFCSACYSQWMERSKECPTCRLPVERMSRNHIINNLVEAYLNQHPEKKRLQKEIDDMDAINKITEDMIRPKKKRKVDEDFVVLEDDEDSNDVSVDLTSDDDSSWGSDQEDEVILMNSFLSGIANQPTSLGSFFGFSSNNSSVSRPPPSVCRWCPRTGQNEATSSQASSSMATIGEIRPGVPQPVCPGGAVHAMCSCCMKPMPMLTNIPPLPGGVSYAKSQKCGICGRFFCHLLWKCDKPNCLGCLNEFKDMKFYNNCLDGVILNNQYESQILKNYVNDKGWTIHDLLSKCLEKLDSKSYTTTDLVLKPELSSKFILCHGCGLKNLKELAFQFRRDIPRNELPAAVTSRPDCHWGKNCRTQTNPTNPHHASRYNHVCDQTRYR